MSENMSLRDDNIPLADDDPQGSIARNLCSIICKYVKVHWSIAFHLHFTDIIDDSTENNMNRAKSTDSLPSMYNDGSSSGAHSLDPDTNPDEQEEKARLISQVLELQNTLDGKQLTKWPKSSHNGNCH